MYPPSYSFVSPGDLPPNHIPNYLAVGENELVHGQFQSSTDQPSSPQDLSTQPSEDSNDGEDAYAHLLFKCLSTAPEHEMSLKHIYEWMELNSVRVRQSRGNGWQNSVRHNLSMNKGFVRIPNKDSKASRKANMWRLHPEALERGHVLATTRYRKTPRHSRVRQAGSKPRPKASKARKDDTRSGSSSSVTTASPPIAQFNRPGMDAPHMARPAFTMPVAMDHWGTALPPAFAAHHDTSSFQGWAAPPQYDMPRSMTPEPYHYEQVKRLPGPRGYTVNDMGWSAMPPGYHGEAGPVQVDDYEGCY